jgi:hypothetical protein
MPNEPTRLLRGLLDQVRGSHMPKRQIPTEYRKHRQRARGEAKPPFEVQPRDLDMLQAIYLNRVLTRELLLILFPPNPSHAPPSRSAAQPKTPGSYIDRRLGKLFHHGYVDRKRITVGGKLIYALADAGATILREQRPALKLTGTKWTEHNRTLTEKYLEHALMVARVCLSLAATVEKAAPLTLGSFQRDSHRKDQKLAAKWRDGAKKITVVPDAFFTLVNPTRPEGQNRLAFFVETDRSTMTLDRMAEKYARYAELLRRHDLLTKHYNVTGGKVLSIAKSDARAENLAAVINDTVPAPLRKFFFTTSETRYSDHPANFLATVWRRGDDPGHHVGIIPDPLPTKR